MLMLSKGAVSMEGATLKMAIRVIIGFRNSRWLHNKIEWPLASELSHQVKRLGFGFGLASWPTTLPPSHLSSPTREKAKKTKSNIEWKAVDIFTISSKTINKNTLKDRICPQTHIFNPRTCSNKTESPPHHRHHHTLRSLSCHSTASAARYHPNDTGRLPKKEQPLENPTTKNPPSPSSGTLGKTPEVGGRRLSSKWAGGA
ncbi:GLUCAN SYNTHASE-LIKE 8 family protein [Dorcoceras hygrometricum]|uniref:GLUCAN SYNTHASE-LIKE 8 family protein n=1 Tax=Dorcoceras hygrometricum TaxID=472368 RepID=A0A2Z7DFA5_9LAMI|nr:GLUCAN SYNTHASE-LIKE 8 family protein [Dorcoceras hygrometricum]